MTSFLNKCTVYNYADDNKLSYAHKQLTVLKNVVEGESQIALCDYQLNFSEKVSRICQKVAR